MPRSRPASDGPKRAVVYRRASLDATGEERSIDRQLEACRALITMRDWVEVGVETDNSISAYGKKERPGWNRVLAMMERGEVDVVVAWHLDRLTRSMLDLEQLILLADEHNVAIATATGDIDLTTDVGRMVARILAAVARAEVERKAARQRFANEQHAKTGKPWRGGARPFGYAANQVDIVEAEAEAIREGAALALGGASMRQIARHWNDAGLVSSRASDTTASGWSGRGVKNVLVSSRYVGVRSYLGEEIGPGTWPSILDLETHLALKAMLTDPDRLLHQHRAGRTPANLLSGLAYCGICGATVNASSNRGTKTYVCRPHAHVVPPRDAADDAVIAHLLGLLQLPDALSILIPAQDDSASTARAELESARRKLSALQELFTADDDDIDAADLKVMSRKLKARIAEAESALLQFSGHDALMGLRLGTAKVIDDWNALEMPRQRRIIENLLDVEIVPMAQGGRGETRAWLPESGLKISVKRPAA